MRYFTEQWYQTGCRRVSEYEAYQRTMADQLPEFFRTHHSLHDSVIKQIHVREVRWNEYEISVKLDSHQAYTPVDRLVFHSKTGAMQDELIGTRWIAEEIFVNGNEYELNVLLMDKDGSLQELTLPFYRMECIYHR